MDRLFFDTSRLNDSEGHSISLSGGSISVYIHIPFCSRKCGYCDFYSVSYTHNTAEKYITEAVSQLAWYLDFLRPETVRTLYIGGGTPSVLTAEQSASILHSINSILPRMPEEITMEVNPESVSRELLVLYHDCGVTRISAGVQSLSPLLLNILGRNAGEDETRKGLDQIHAGWNGEWSCDMIAGIPGQDLQTLRSDLERIIAYGPDHISLYDMIIEEGTPLEKKISSGVVLQPDEEEETALRHSAFELLGEKGYTRYEIANFARNGKVSRHNLGYWRMEPYIGIGPAAAGSLLTGDGKLVRIEARRSLEEYLGGIDTMWGSEAHLLSREDYFLEYLIMGLRINEGIEHRETGRRFGGESLARLRRVASSERFSGKLLDDGERIRCTKEGWEILNRIIVDLSILFDEI